jgi:hypothetical protein
MMNLSEAVAPDPAAPETVAGGSYLPQTPPVNPQAAVKGIAGPKELLGQAREVNDLPLTLSGISDGDPVGMETFDLGFFEDGTPAVVINGANVPIQQSQWMALLTMRNKTREEIKSQMQFEQQRARAIDSVSRITRAMQLNAGMSELFMAQAQIDPAMAMENLNKLYVAKASGNSKNLESDIAAQITATKIAPAWKHLTEDRGEIEVEGVDPYGNPSVQKKKLGSRAEEASRRLAAKNNREEQVAAMAFARPGDMFIDPNFRKAYPGQRIGIFDKVAQMEQDRYGPMSLFERMKGMAKHGQGVWPEQIDIVNPPMISDTTSDSPRYQFGGSGDFLNYLQRLDQFYANIGGWDLSTPESLEQVASEYTRVYWQQHGFTSSPETQTGSSSPAPQQAPSRGRPSAL